MTADASSSTPGGAGADRAGDLTPLAISGWALLSVGLAGVVGGGVALALDGREISSGAQGREVLYSKTAGGATLGVGLGVAAVGAVLLIVDAVRGDAASAAGAADAARGEPPRRAGAQPRAAASLQPTLGPGGLGVGLSGRF